MKPNWFKLSFKLAILVSLFLFLLQPALATQGDNPFPDAAPSDDLQDEKPEEEEEKKDEVDDADNQDEVADTATLRTKTDVSGKYVRFHMWDGSIVAGEVSIDDISIKTEFGTLQIPIQRIKKLYPGLDSFPELNAKIMGLVEGLGDKDFDVREKSHRALSAMGIQIRNELENFKDGGSAERKKRLAAIRTEIETALDEFEQEGETSPERSLIRGDAVETPEFSAVGKILQETFSVDSKFGKLTVMLSDIKMAERSFNEVPEEIRKNIDVAAEAFFQRTPTSTKIRVNQGDKITIRAEGVVQWTNWSSSSTPDGMTNQGQYQGINSGTLCARVGSKGKIVKIGTKDDFVAKRSGVLYLAIAMQDSHQNNSGYKWTGKYKAKVHVKPAELD